MKTYVRATAMLVFQDLRLAYRNNLLQVSIALCVIFGLLVRFVIPAAPGDVDLLLYDASDSGAWARVVEASGQEPRFGDEAEWRAALAQDGSPGILLDDEGYEVALRGTESPSRVELMETTAHGLWRAGKPGGPELATVRALRPERDTVPFNTGLIPLLLAMDVIILGYLFGSVMLLQKKMNGTMSALRASPATPGQLIASTVAVNVLMAWMYAIGLLIATGPGVYPVVEMLALVSVACAAFTLLGLFVAVFFDNLSQMFAPMMAIGLLLSVPMGTHFSAAKPPLAITLIPTYGAMRAFDEMFFPAGRDTLVLEQLGVMAGLVVLFGAMTWFAMDRRLFKEAV